MAAFGDRQMIRRAIVIAMWCTVAVLFAAVAEQILSSVLVQQSGYIRYFGSGAVRVVIRFSLFSSVVVLGAYTWARGYESESAWRFGPAVTAILIGVGIATGLGVTRATGCDTSGLPWVLQSFSFMANPPWQQAGPNVAISMTLAVAVGISSTVGRSTAGKLLTLEVVAYVVFLLAFRGGYAVGFAGSPCVGVVEFDLLTAGFHGGVLPLVIQSGRRQSSKQGIVTGVGVLCGTALVLSKLLWFRVPRW